MKKNYKNESPDGKKINRDGHSCIPPSSPQWWGTGVNSSYICYIYILCLG